jgi:hypothetical protein
MDEIDRWHASRPRPDSFADLVFLAQTLDEQKRRVRDQHLLAQDDARGALLDRGTQLRNVIDDIAFDAARFEQPFHCRAVRTRRWQNNHAHFARAYIRAGRSHGVCGLINGSDWPW